MLYSMRLTDRPALGLLLTRLIFRVLQSINAGKRLAESRFAVLNVAPKGQQSVAGMFGRK